MPLARGAKNVARSPSENAFLGVISDLSRFVEGEAYMRSKPSRIAKLIATIDEYIESRSMRMDPLSFFGKLEFTASSAGYCRVGRAALAALRAWHMEVAAGRGGGPDGPLPPAVMEALAFFRSVLPRLPPRRFRFAEHRMRRRPIIVYTDAM